MSDGVSPRRTRLLGIALILVTFVVGGFTGAAATRVLSARPTEDAMPKATARAPAARGDESRDDESPEERPDGRRASIFDQLDLAADQRTRVDAVLARRNAEIEAFWDEAGPRLRAIVDAARADIREILTPAQEKEYDRLRKERRRNRCERTDQDDEREAQE